jgi:hypothetical protein
MLDKMTSILYGAPMTNTPILPESVQPGKHYSFAADMKLNAWALVAVVASFVAREVLKNHHDWGATLRSVVALTPMVPSLLYVRSISRWIGGMDELQRRIQLEAALFATTATVFLRTSLDLLEGIGTLQSTRLRNGLGWEGTFAAIIVFYILGSIIFNRRFR